MSRRSSLEKFGAQSKVECLIRISNSLDATPNFRFAQQLLAAKGFRYTGYATIFLQGPATERRNGPRHVGCRGSFGGVDTNRTAGVVPSGGGYREGWCGYGRKNFRKENPMG